ncbi:MAG: DUF2142 domain-containing protein [Anaerolineae bacterium]|nr:DUF2142 domain-containing protein [Anaerolineae bacterium]
MNPSARPPGDASRPLFAGLLPLLLAVTLLRGLVYLAVMPPWQHYDEPTHFEYVRLLAERKRLPQPGDYDLEMRREIAASMQAAGFYKDLGPQTLDFFSPNPPNIGITELTHPPLYYVLLALPQTLLLYQDVETQLYVGRLVSVLLYVVVVAAVYALTRELSPRRPGLALAAAGVVVFLPPVTDVMSSVNNDVGAAAAATLFLWATVRLLRRGPTFGRVAVLLLLAGTCALVKNTAGLVALSGLLVVAGSWLPVRRRWLPWALAGLVLLGLLIAAPDWQGYAAGWYGRGASAPLRQRTETPLGKFALVLSPEGEEHPATIAQELPPARGRPLAGQPATLGAWLKGTGEPGQQVELRVRDGAGVHAHRAALTAEWQFVSFTATVAPSSSTVEAAVAIPRGSPPGHLVYADGLILAAGAHGPQGAPQFADGGARRATWNGQEIGNLLHNGSAEAAWPGLPSWLLGAQMYRAEIQDVFHSILDLQRTAWVYPRELWILHKSFWGGFGWAHLWLPEPWFYALAALTLAAVAGVVLGLVRRGRGPAEVPAWKRRSWWALGLAVGVTAIGTLFHIHPLYHLAHIYWPVARYLTVTIGPLAIALCAGLAELLPRRYRAPAGGVGLLGLVVLDAVAIWTVLVPYYYGS